VMLISCLLREIAYEAGRSESVRESVLPQL
jgi:hypothetical protein